MEIVKCLLCENEFINRSNLTRKFCSSSCSAKYSNQQRKSTYSSKHLQKSIPCQRCNTVFDIPLNACASSAFCVLCKPKKIYSKACSNCGNLFESKWGCRKTCSNECRIIASKAGASIGGKNSAAIQSNIRRSKNEIAFARLCESLDSILTNKPIFNGWDADVILPTYKVAVMWNGIWHHRKIAAKHSVLQVQARAKIKLKEIINAGFTPYVIDDLGMYNSSFVLDQFSIFKKWLESTTKVL